MKKILALFALLFTFPAFSADCREYGVPGRDMWFKTAEEACRSWGDLLKKSIRARGMVIDIIKVLIVRLGIVAL